MKYYDRLEWFTDRIGKRVYREKNTCCDCPSCRDAYKNGVLITDYEHASYLSLIEHEGKLHYFDSREEVIKNLHKHQI